LVFGANKIFLGLPDHCMHTASRWIGQDFSFNIPSELQQNGGMMELRVYVLSDWDWHNAQQGTLQKELFVVSPQFWIEPQACTDTSFVTYEQVFKQGTTVRVVPQNPNEVGFRGENPVFCHSAPLLKQYNESNQVFEQSNAEYDLLNNGSAVTVPVGQQWIMFYRGLPAISGVLECEDQGGIWNATDNQCELPPTLWFVCNGILTQQQDCVVQTTDYRCQDPMAVLETQPDGSFICRKYFDVEEMLFNCPIGSSLKEGENGFKFCEYQPVEICNGGTIQNGVCTVPLQPVSGNVGGNILSGIDLLFIVVIIIIGVAVFWFPRKH